MSRLCGVSTSRNEKTYGKSGTGLSEIASKVIFFSPAGSMLKDNQPAVGGILFQRRKRDVIKG